MTDMIYKENIEYMDSKLQMYIIKALSTELQRTYKYSKKESRAYIKGFLDCWNQHREAILKYYKDGGEHDFKRSIKGQE